MFDFLAQPADFDIGETGLFHFNPSQPLWFALLVGLGNTLRVAVPSLVVCTLLATGVAMARRSTSPLWRALAACYVDTVRNVPLLLQLLMLYFMLIEVLPASDQAWVLAPGLLLSKGGLAFPWPVSWSGDAGVEAGFWSWPVQGAFNVSGGAAVSPEYLALASALSLYTAAFLSEVIRGGLDSVSPALAEAAQTLGARPWQVSVKVVLPQALRAIVPAATNQYLNLLKNASLGVAVGFPDLVSVGNTALNQTGQAVACVSVMMAVYLSLSLMTSAFMNWFNRRHALKGVA